MQTNLRHKKRISIQILFGLALLFILIMAPARPALAGFEVARIPTDNLPPGTPGLGGGIRLSRDLYVGNDRDPDLVPLYLYEGKWIFAEGTAAGVHAYKNDFFQADVLIRAGFLGLDPSEYPDLEGLDRRHQTLDAGISTGLRGNWGGVRLEWVADTLNNHNGSELDISYRYPFKFGDFSLTPFVTLSYFDDDKSNYYFGVTPQESDRTGIPAYMPGSTQNFTLGVATSWQITDQIFAFANLGFMTLDSKIQDSPIVGEEIATTVYAGAGYFFGAVKNSKYLPEERQGEWSWRVNYGYTGNHNIVPEPMQGNLTKSTKVNTEILGFTAGKLLQGGKRVDIWGKAALYRHFEEPIQDDFWNFTAYVMAIGKGYFPWSDRQAFRWGFGLGASYAQEVPAIEVFKQSERDRNTNKFLNYLEFMVDFPIDGIIKSKLTKNCFLGLVVAHRSGIFSTSDILGQVAGGADWYTLSLECVR